MLAKLTSAIAAAGGQIEALGLHGDSETVTFKVVNLDRQKLLDAVGSLVDEILDVRET